MSDIVMGVEVGPGFCSGCLVAPRGSKGDLHRQKLPMSASATQIKEAIAGMCLELKHQASIRGWSVSNVGISINGLISDDGEILHSRRYPDLVGENIDKYIRAETGLSSLSVNRYQAIAWGEHLFGGGRRMRCCLVVFMGSSVGSGLIVERRLWPGVDGAAGKIGHVSVSEKSRPCSCGRIGCLEQFVSYKGIRATLARLRETEKFSGLEGLDLEAVTIEQIIDQALRGDQLAIEVVRQVGDKLGVALCNVDAVLNLDGIVIAGPLSKSASLIGPSILSKLSDNRYTAPRRQLMVVPEEIGEASGCVGAAMRAWEKFS